MKNFWRPFLSTGFCDYFITKDIFLSGNESKGTEGNSQNEGKIKNNIFPSLDKKHSSSLGNIKWSP